MALRCLLVSLVASLGFELPSGQDVTSWTRFGRDWAASRTITLADLRDAAPTWSFGGDPDPAMVTSTNVPAVAATPVPAPAMPEAVDDAAFAALNDSLVAAFESDLEMTRLAATADALAAAEASRQAEHDSMALAHAEPEAPPAEAAAEVAPALAVVATDEASDEEHGEASARPSSRLGTAVRATREAMNAWASLVEAVGREVVTR